MPFKYVSQPKTLNEFILEALYAGIVGGSAIALFFLVADLMDGRPLYTPSLIGSMLFLGVGIEDVKVRFDAIAYFSLLHIVIFTALGAITSFIVHEVEIHARHPALLLLGLFGVIEASFFIIAPLAMPGLIHELTIARVAIGNLAAATALTAFFVITHHSKTRGKFRHRRGDVIFDSFFSGAVGGTTVAMFFFVVDIIDGHPFFTPALIGHVLILGESAKDVVNPVMSNSVILMVPIHFAWSITVGFISSWLVHNIELRSRHPVELIIVLFVVIEVAFLLAVPVLMPGVIAKIGMVRMLGVNLLAAGTMSYFFMWSHTLDPGTKMTSEETGEEEAGVSSGSVARS